MKSWTPPTDEMIEKALASVKKETDRQYFFSKLKNPLWLGPLHDRGYFDNPPGRKPLSDGYVQYPHWPELAYLVTIAGEAPDQVANIVLSLPKTDNPRVYEDILAIALKLKGRESARLLPKLIEYIEVGDTVLAHRFPELLQHWTAQGAVDIALEIVKKLLPFREDPRVREKQQLRKDRPHASGTLLEPVPRFDQWDYQQILEKGVRPLAEKEPYQVVCILIDAVTGMICLGMHRQDFDKGRDEDYSEIWCPRLENPDRDDRDVKETLVHTLTYACEQVYDKVPQSIDALDQALRNQRWKLFKRLRHHLYASHPNDQTLPWIREEIRGRDDYSKWELHYEFQLMVRRASEHFGTRLLSEGEREAIFEAILSGPSKEDFHEWMGERYSEDAFQERQRHFHRVQLRPFSALLSGEMRRYFDELMGEIQAEALTDDSYAPFSEARAGTVSDRSPKSVDDLESLTDEELLTYLNDWDEEHWDTDNCLVEINISALAGVFQSLFKERVVTDGERLGFWMANRDRIVRPVYVSTMVNVMQELVKDRNFANLDRWIEFCRWVLSHPDAVRVEGQPEPRDESRDHPDWGSSRRAVVDFIDACVNKETNAPVSVREGLAHLLQQVCNQFDWRLDHDRPVLLNRDHAITEAISNTRSRALASLIKFGFWIRRNLPEDRVREVGDILSKRLAGNAEFPLTRPERALLGMHFGHLYDLKQDWAVEHRKIIFPQGDEAVWRDAFGSYIRFNRPSKAAFEILRGEFQYAVENMNVLTDAKDDGTELVGKLGEHVFFYYVWEVYPLTGDESLLERFYDLTNGDRKHWAQLFDCVGRTLGFSGKHLDKSLTERVVAYFDWRLVAAEPMELQEFAHWLQAECLDPEWRLRSYSKILDLGCGKDMGLSLELNALHKLLPDHLALVVECFAKRTDAIDHGTQVYISSDEAKPILAAGLNAEDSRVRENAERARENLLRLGHFEYLDVE